MSSPPMTRALWVAFAASTHLPFRLALATMLSALATASCATTASTSAAAPAAVHAPSEGGLPFSPVVRVGPMLYLSGQIGTTNMSPPALAAGGIEAEARQTLEN